MPEKLTIETLKAQAAAFAARESEHEEPSLFGINDGKTVGTYIEHKFQVHLESVFEFKRGNSSRGTDFPRLNVDIKFTSIRQPQSSCPFKSARQKIYGLGYDLLIFVYSKTDDEQKRTCNLKIEHVLFVESSRTADFQTTSGLVQILDNDGNLDDITAFFQERMLPVDEIQAKSLGEEVLRNRPELGYLTISNALQWRLQYKRAIEKAGDIEGIESL